MKPPLATMEEIREFTKEIDAANSDKLGHMLVSAKKMLSQKKHESVQNELRMIIKKIEKRYVPLRKAEIHSEPQQYWF